MSLERVAVQTIEKLLNIRISRHPLQKFYGEFIDLANLELISQSTGVLHIGAHLGLESDEYSRLGKPVIFIEADPETYMHLQNNIKTKIDQAAYNLLLGDQEKYVKFFRASNGSQSSSVFSFSAINKFKAVTTVATFELLMCRLDSKFSKQDLLDYDHWVIDVQGAELLVLIGAGSLINQCQTIFIECSTEEFYEGGARWNEIHDFLKVRGFKYLIAPKDISHLNVIFFRSTK